MLYKQLKEGSNPSQKGYHLLASLKVKKRVPKLWSEKEQKDFRTAYNKFGRDWAKISKFVVTKDKKSIQLYAEQN